MKSNTEMMVGQRRVRYGSSKYTQEVKRNAKRSYRRRMKHSLKELEGEVDLDNLSTPVVDPTSYGYID